MNYDISRFIEAQRSSYQQALSEIKNGKKRVIGYGIFFRRSRDSGAALCPSITVSRI